MDQSPEVPHRPPAARAAHRPVPLEHQAIRTPDQRLRVFVSSTIEELAPERAVVREAVEALHLTPILFELGARPHPAQTLYQAYLEQSHLFLGIYWQKYGWVGPGMEISGLEHEYRLAVERGMPMLLYLKRPSPELEPGLKALIDRIRDAGDVSYRRFSTLEELRSLVADDLALVLTERFELSRRPSLHAADVGPVVEDAMAERRWQLPAAPNRLIGRERELDFIFDLVLRDGVRLVTLSGPGGIGKTRLALAAAEGLAERFDDGVGYVPLASVRERALVATAIAHALGLGQATGIPPVDSITTYLRDRDFLLVLDNFEHVIDAAELVAGLLRDCPRLKVLVTSREVLRITGEHVVPVRPLDMPATDRRITLERAQSAAVQLFLERARAVQPEFRLTADNLSAVVRICRRLDGLPLAIELAAARVRSLPPEAILRRLDRRLKLLTGGARDLPERQRALRQTIEWSYGLLSPSERALFARLAVFSSRWTLAAAEEICNPDGDLDLLEGIESLVEKSLVLQVAASDEPRYTMLQTITEYATEVLAASGEADRFYSAHAAHYLAVAERAEHLLRGPLQDDWVFRLDHENDNLRVAMRWFIDQGRLDEATRLGWALWLFWWLHGHAREGVRWFEEVLAHPGTISAFYYARALAMSGSMSYLDGQFARGEEQQREAVRLMEENADEFGAAHGHIPLGMLALTRGDAAEARHLLLEARRRFEALGDEFGVALALAALGRLLTLLGTPDRDEVLQRALQASSAIGSKIGIGASLDSMAWGAVLEGDYERAGRCAGEGLYWMMTIKQGEGATRCVEDLAAVAAARGHAHWATQLFAACASYRNAVGSPMWIADRPQYPEILETLRQQLGDEEYAAAVAEGETYTVERTVNEAYAIAREAGWDGSLSVGAGA